MSDEVQRALGRIEGKLDKLDTVLAVQRGHERRISSLERWKAWTYGVATTVGIFIGLMWKVIPYVR